MKDNKQTILLLIVIVLAAWNIFTTNGIKTDVKAYKEKIESIQVEVDSAQVVNKEIDNKVSEVKENVAWKKENSDNHFFKYRSDIWCEKEGGKTVHKYKQTAKTDDSLTLYDDERQVFIKLTDDLAYTGKKFDEIDQVFSRGNWMKFLILR